MKEIDLEDLKRSLEGVPVQFYSPHFKRWMNKHGTFFFWDELTKELFNYVSVLRRIAILEQKELPPDTYVLPEELARLSQVMGCLNAAFSASYYTKEMVAQREDWRSDEKSMEARKHEINRFN